MEATQRLKHSAVKPVEHRDERGIRHRLRYLDGVPLNETHIEREVNFLESWERRSDGRELHFARVTDLPIGDTHAMESMRAARARWRIENETFDTLKNQGYHFEHTFGHGHKHLATVLASLMMPALLIDQVQQRCCTLFAKARTKGERPRYFWERVRAVFLDFPLADWETLYKAIAFGYRGELVVHDTSSRLSPGPGSATGRPALEWFYRGSFRGH